MNILVVLKKCVPLIIVTLHKKKSDVIREAIEFYASSVESHKKSRILLAVEKTKEADKEVHKHFEGTLNDGL